MRPPGLINNTLFRSGAIIVKVIIPRHHIQVYFLITLNDTSFSDGSPHLKDVSHQLPQSLRTLSHENAVS